MSRATVYLSTASAVIFFLKQFFSDFWDNEHHGWLACEPSQADKTAIELFLAGIRGRDAGLLREINDGNLSR